MLKKILVLCLLIAALSALWLGFILTKANQLSGETAFEIKPGSSVTSIAEQLETNQLIDSALLFKVYIRLLNKTQQIKAGEFIIPAQQSMLDIVTLLSSGKAKQYSFTIVEGTSIWELLAQLSKVDNLQQDIPINDYAALLKAIQANETYPEGLFLADTYYYTKDMPVSQLLKRSYQSMQNFLDSAWSARDQQIPLKTPYEAIILASIIEKETAVADERKKIAGVFVNRLRKGMRLQTDPTVIYGLGQAFDGDIKYRDLRTDTPYNTYTRSGLPPTPIAMPGKAAIQAALHPETTEALFFVANGEGGHTFSNTLREHEAAVKVYLQKIKS